MREMPSLHKHAVAYRASRTAWKIITQARSMRRLLSNFAQNGPFLRKIVTRATHACSFRATAAYLRGGTG
jgi:hypothetical protein